MTAKFSVGQKVNHPAARDHSFPAGTGVVVGVHQLAGGGWVYAVHDAANNPLGALFKESELSPA